VPLSAQQKIAQWLDSQSPHLLYSSNDVASGTGVSGIRVRELASQSKNYSVKTQKGWMWGSKSAIRKLKRLCAKNG